LFLRRRLETGIHYDDVWVELGWVSEFEERDSALKSGYVWEEWIKLSTMDRARHVAFHRVRTLVNAHAEEAANEERVRQQRRRQNAD
jgi:hypothetical protein